jgi:hypothetical protein
MKKLIVLILLNLIPYLGYCANIEISSENTFIGDNVSVLIKKCGNFDNLTEKNNKSFEIINKKYSQDKLQIILIPFDLGNFNFHIKCNENSYKFSLKVKERLSDNISEIADTKDIEKINLKNNTTLILTVLTVFLILLIILLVWIYFLIKNKRNENKHQISLKEKYMLLKKNKKYSQEYFNNLISLYKEICGQITNVNLEGKTTEEISELADRHNIEISVKIFKDADFIKFSNVTVKEENINEAEREIEKLLKKIGEENV